PRDDGKPGRDRYLVAQAMKEALPAGINIDSLPFHPRSLIAAPDLLQINGRGMLAGRSVSVTFNYRAAESQLIVTIDGVDTNLRADTLSDLLHDHPIELRKYLSPLLRCVRPEASGDLLAASWADIYLTLDAIAPPRSAVEQVHAILPNLQ